MTTRLKSACKAGILVAACVSLAICSSCSDEDMMNSSGQSDKLSFGVSISDKWETAPGTRSTAGETPERSAFKFDGSDMWLIATSEEGMDSTLFTKPEKTQTRAAAVTPGSFYDSFGVYAYVYEGNDWTSGQNVKPYFTAEKVTQSSGDLWTTSPTRFWPGEQYRMQFFACAPYDITQKVTMNDNTPELAYTVPEEVKDQKDLIVATADVQGNYNSSLPLKFKHILTAVKVKAAEGVSGTITKVALKGIKYKGTHVLGTSAWDVDEEATKDFELSCLVTLDPTIEGGTFIVDDDNTFMMIPQILAGNAELEVTFSDGTVLTGGLSDKTDWEIGHTVVYKISRTGDEYIFEVKTNYDPQEYFPPSQTITNGKLTLSVTSYKLEANNHRTPVNWKITEYCVGDPDNEKNWQNTWTDKQYSRKCGNSAQWLEVPQDPTSVSDIVTTQNMKLWGRSYTNDWDKNERVITDMNKNWVEHSIPSVGTDDAPFDLSKYDFTKYLKDSDVPTDNASVETANCYVIRNPGTYKFPLVYGNGIKNGEKNESAYSGKYDHEGKNITSPFIQGATKVELLWQDYKGLITDVVLLPEETFCENNVQYVKFTTATQEAIQQGNALIAVKNDEGTVLWSWHIWVTNNEEVTRFTPMQNASGNSNPMSNLNLGYCNDVSEYWPERKVYVKVVQDLSLIHI